MKNEINPGTKTYTRQEIEVDIQNDGRKKEPVDTRVRRVGIEDQTFHVKTNSEGFETWYPAAEGES